MSGIDTRLEFKKRSKSRSYFSGHKRVMSSRYATIEPAAEPRPGPTGNVVVARPLDQVPDDQEVRHEAEFADDRLLVLEALDRRLVVVAVELDPPLLEQPIEESVRRLARVADELRHVVLTEREVDVDLLGDVHRRGHRLGQVAEHVRPSLRAT